MSSMMLKKITSIHCNESSYEVRLFQTLNGEGKISYCTEVDLGPHDKIILDARNIGRLEGLLHRILPVTVYSRVVAGMGD